MLNQCNFIGNLGRDPEVRLAQNGNKIVNMSLAVSEKWKDKDGQRQERTEWVRLVVFDEKLADVAEKYLKKGSKIYVSGKMQTRKWTGNDGQDKYTTEVVLPKFGGVLTMLDGKSDNQEEPRQDEPQEPQGGGGSADLDDEIPF